MDRRYRGARVNGCLLIALVAIFALQVPMAWAQDGEAIATLEAYRGSLQVVRQGRSVPLARGLGLQRDDIIVTRRGNGAVRFMSDGTQLRIAPNSRVQIDETAEERGIQVFFGRMWARVVSFRERQTRVRTGATIAAVRGTEIAVDYDEETTQLWVFDGEMQAQNDLGSLTIVRGQSAIAGPGKAPSMQLSVRPQDAVQWALHYLPVLYDSPDHLTGNADWERAVREAVSAYREGDLATALGHLDGVPDGSGQSADFHAFRASLLLAAGSVDQANADIERALNIDSTNANAQALRSIMLIASNDTEQALAAARQAVSSDGDAAAPQIALSYAQQATFDLASARQTLIDVVVRHKDNALAWARLSELHLSFGDTEEALLAAQRAAELEPDLARTQTVLGFAHLTQTDTESAKNAFSRSIDLDQGDPVTRLGMGLALIREGDLDSGIREMEVASSLDPANSVVRSYLGKAYFEAKRPLLDSREFMLAKEFDPLDPTPWFYDAIAKQTLNNPIEALRDMNAAIERNDNRAIYRSRLLLDSDVAARNASLGRIYSDLGFQQGALIQGWQSTSIDPTNHSGHRLLADSYAARPRHEIARVSELLQAQMLQPLNTTPIQPRLAESNLFLLSSQGPDSLSFNEFNPLFNRNQVNAQTNAYFGEDSTWLGEAVVSGVFDRASFSIGYNQYSTDGFRANSDQDDEIANAFVQFQVSPDTSLQAEVRYRDYETGDLERRFLPNDFRPDLRERNERTSVRAGLTHSFSPGSTLLVSYVNQDKEITFFDGPDFLSGLLELNLDREEDADTLEAQYLFRSDEMDGFIKNVNLTMGAGSFDIQTDELQRLLIDLPPPPFGPGPIEDAFALRFDTQHTNLYAYANLGLPGNLTLTLGVSADDFEEVGEGGLGDRDETNPKVGLTWKATDRTTVRAAAFSVLKRTLVTDQTLEPTHVAGFNQFYDDPTASRSDVYGLAIDHRFSDRYFFGAEYSKRELEIPSFFFNIDTFELDIIDLDADERVSRVYLFGTPRDWLSFSIEYQQEKLSQDPRRLFGFENVRTNRLPMEARFFFGEGWSTTVRATALDQEGSLELRELPFGFFPAESDFWIFDANVRYRLPGRRGILTFGVNNLTDEDDNYLAIESILPSAARNLSIRPGRVAYASFTLAWQ